VDRYSFDVGRSHPFPHAGSSRRFPHVPLDLGEGAGPRLLNPGSPTDRRRQPRGTMGLLRVEAGELVQARIVPVT
jgi:hypothetical protein